MTKKKNKKVIPLCDIHRVSDLRNFVQVWGLLRVRVRLALRVCVCACVCACVLTPNSTIKAVFLHKHRPKHSD